MLMSGCPNHNVIATAFTLHWKLIIERTTNSSDSRWVIQNHKLDIFLTIKDVFFFCGHE